ncbi:MAG: hypothetical protein ACF8GE_00780 [Phycisphaerales bacterium JB043]
MVLASAGSARAQEIEADAGLALEAEPVELELVSPWVVQVEPSLWRPGLFGSIQAPGSVGETELEDIDLDESGYAGAIEAKFRLDEESSIRWNAFVFEQSERSIAKDTFTFGSVSGVFGDAVSSEVRFSSVELVYEWEWWSKELPAKDPRDSVRMNVDAYAGLRAYDIAFDVSANGGMMRADQQWIDVIVGARLEVDLAPDLAFDFAADVGGMGLGDYGSFSGNVLTGFHWRPDERLGVQFGYRFLFNSVVDGDEPSRFEWIGSTAGVYLGAVWRF